MIIDVCCVWVGIDVSMPVPQPMLQPQSGTGCSYETGMGYDGHLKMVRNGTEVGAVYSFARSQVVNSTGARAQDSFIVLVTHVPVVPGQYNKQLKWITTTDGQLFYHLTDSHRNPAMKLVKELSNRHKYQLSRGFAKGESLGAFEICDEEVMDLTHYTHGGGLDQDLYIPFPEVCAKYRTKTRQEWLLFDTGLNNLICFCAQIVIFLVI
jgi:hypothetical protein